MADYVEVTGVGRVDRTPDVLVARLGAEAASGAVAEALTAADAGFRAMVAAAVDAGVARRDVATGGLNVHPHHDHAGRQSGYLASMGLVLVLRDIGTAGAVVSAVVAAGRDAARVYSATLALDDAEAALAEAREAAFADARAQAERLASLAGRPLGAVRRIRDRAPMRPGTGWVEQAGRQAVAVASVGVEPGTTEVAASVTVRWQLD